MKRFSFQRGFDNLPKKNVKEVKFELMKVLNITSSPAWYDRLHGRVEPRVTEVERIEEVFRRYGVTEIWGDPTDV